MIRTTALRRRPRVDLVPLVLVLGLATLVVEPSDASEATSPPAASSGGPTTEVVLRELTSTTDGEGTIERTGERAITADGAVTLLPLDTDEAAASGDAPTQDPAAATGFPGARQISLDTTDPATTAGATTTASPVDGDMVLIAYAQADPTATPAPEPSPTSTPTPEPSPTSTSAPEPSPTATTDPDPSPTASAPPEPEPEPEPEPTATPSPEECPDGVDPDPEPTATPEPTPEPSASPEPTPTPTPTDAEPSPCPSDGDQAPGSGAPGGGSGGMPGGRPSGGGGGGGAGGGGAMGGGAGTAAPTGLGGTSADAAGQTGTDGKVLTSIADIGAELGTGSVAFTLDAQPAVVVITDVVMYRSLTTDSEDGADVEALERALVELGFGDGVTVDEHYSSETADAVEAWEEALGRADPDGEVDLGEIVALPEASAVLRHDAVVGATVSTAQTVLTVAGEDRVVVIDPPADTVGDWPVGTAVDLLVEEVVIGEGTVTSISPDVTGGGVDSTGTRQVLIDPGTALAGRPDGAAVTARTTTRATGQSPTVPVAALIADSDGAPAVRVVTGGTDVLTPVTVTDVSDGFAALDGVEEGTTVRLPG